MGETAMTEFHNYIRLQVLLENCTQTALQNIFLRRYKLIHSKEWSDVSLDGKICNLKKACPDAGSLSKDQMSVLKTGDICLWDTTLLSLILLNTKYSLSTLKSSVQPEISNENKAIGKLRDLRNKLAHIPGESVPDKDFMEIWSEASGILTDLRFSADKIDHIRTTSKLEGVEFHSNSINEENMCRSKFLRESGNHAFRSSELNEAIKDYSKALLLTGLSRFERATLYSNRSHAYVKMLDGTSDSSMDSVNECKNQAFEDARMVTKLSPTWWKGYYRLGQAYKYDKDFKRALHWFDYALNLNPELSNVREARDQCRCDAVQEEIQEHLDPHNIFQNHTETMRHLADTRGIDRHINAESLTNFSISINKKWMESACPEDMAVGCVFMAHRYYNGDGFRLDKEMAASLFKRAADAGNAEGMYNLGLMYFNGECVQRDVAKAAELFRKAATQPFSGNKLKDIGIGPGMYMVGKCYQDGVAYIKSPAAAVWWYRRASFEGVGNASHNLGILYDKGLGVERNSARAIQYWKLAVEQNCPLAMNTLFVQFVELDDVDQAETWLKRSATGGCIPGIVHMKEHSEFIAAWRSRSEKFKQTLPQHLRKIPVGRLRQNALKNTAPDVTKAAETVVGSRNYLPSSKGDLVTSPNFMALEPEIRKHATEGRKYAQKLLSAMQYFVAALKDLTVLLRLETVGSNTDVIAGSKEAIISDTILENLAKCFKLEHAFATFSNTMSNKLLSLIQHAFQYGDEVTKRNARICQCYLLLNLLEECSKFAEVSKKMYPEEPFFHYIHTGTLGFLGNYTEGAEAAQNGIELCGEDYEILYLKAVHLRNILPRYQILISLHNYDQMVDQHHATAAYEDFSPYDKATQAYIRFLELAPKDHRKFPESYYSLALITWLARPTVYQKFEEYYQQGLQAEKEILASFIPYDSLMKPILEAVRSTVATSKRQKIFTVPSGNLWELDAEEIEKNGKLQATNPKRVVVTRKHRNALKANESFSFVNTYQALHVQRASMKTAALQAITFEEMDPTNDHVYRDHIINLTIMEDSLYNRFSALHSVVKDDNGDFQNIYFYKVGHDDPEVRNSLFFGSKIRVQNPYFRLAADMSVGIRVYDPRSIIYVSRGDINSLCRFCWKENARLSCSKCRRAKYCNKECQTQDWKLLKHSFICKKKNVKA